MATDDDLKHKPSPKHTLDEVLKSLQDLVRNDLLDENPPAKTPAKEPLDPSVPRKRGRPRKEVTEPETPPPTAPRKARDDLEEVLASLEQLVGSELSNDDNRAARPAGDSRGESSAIPPSHAKQARIPAATAPAQDGKGSAAEAKPHGDQHQFSFDAAAERAPPASPRAERPTPAMPRPTANPRDSATRTKDKLPPRAPGTAEPSIPDRSLDDLLEAPTADDEAITVTLEAAPSSPQTEPAIAAERAVPRAPADDSGGAPAPETAAEAMDIPVLEDAVAFPLPLEEPEPLPPVVVPGFEPGQVRKLAVRVVARLNIELRKKGERPIKAKVIDRLQRILAEELESLARNMENKRP